MNKILIIALILLGVSTRLIEHPPNFTPILSIAMLSGVYFKNRFSFIIPISIMLLSDIFIGNHLTSPWVYSSILIIYLIGLYAMKNESFKNIFIGAISSSIVFFVITNLGVWVIGYPKDITGLLACYTAAIPFYKNTFLSVILYTSLIHGGYLYLLKKHISYKNIE